MVKLTIIISCLLLTSCATTRETFDCKYSKGVGCHSITEVNAMVNDGKLDSKMGSKPQQDFNIKAPIVPNDLSIKRVTEQHLRVWVAPHQDEQGNFHEGAKVHTVLKPGFWQIN